MKESEAGSQAIKEMKESEAGSQAIKTKAGSFPPLNTCRRIESGGLIYSMSLLAFCGFPGKEDMVEDMVEDVVKDMVDLLLNEGAGNSAVLKHTVCMQSICILWSETKFLTEPIRA